MMRIGISAALLIGIAMLAARGARADDGHERANALYRQGAAAALRGNHGEAYADFAESYRLWPRGATLGNIGWAEVELGQVLEGLRHLKEAAHAPDLDSTRRAVIEKNIEEISARTSHLAIQADEGAHVAIDGVPAAGTAPFEKPIDVLPGRRTIEVSLGTRTRRAAVEASAGTVVTADLRMAAAPPDAPLAVPDGARAPSLPPLAGPADGPHGDRHAPASWWSLPRTLGVGLAATALVGLGAGASFEAASQASAEGASRLRAGLGPGACTSGAANGACGTLRDKLNAVHADESVAHVAFVVGGAAAVGAAIALVVGTRRDAAQTSGLRWTLGPAAADVRWAF
jgi:hypothetical protein